MTLARDVRAGGDGARRRCAPADAARLLQFVWEHREDDYKFGYACMIFHILFYFGFRRSEILGLKKSQINIAKGYVNRYQCTCSVKVGW